MAVDVIYEDNHLIAVNKASGDITQGDKTGDLPLPDKIKLWLAEKYKKEGNVFCGVIHRLDRPTSGLVVFSKTSKALSRMNLLFKTREVEKVYWAIVETKPKEDTGSLIDYLKKNKDQNKSYSVKKGTPEAKEAVLDYKLIAQSDRYFLLEVYPQTGRHHQIRTQLANIGSIIKGDVKYGAKRSNKDGSISLHARKVKFIHPVKKEPIEITAKVPNEPLWKWFEKEVG
ncbi:RluA family pseudouridine synthase [Brumimicrobium oceani]|uniref:RNA pseudouridine synthase n=1 Tax=Brumimicrobium oceani TaxID=2100725 RepID=A0A2U2XEX1_9FLAO|nr:RluA family pseudouridine synthase [Brumimicrobium oceani]PWH86297.1 RNA pseudouridine synthase [Brumimicrobium oceani]